MLKPALVVARKEVIDALRDVRALTASAFYALMGPLVIGMVSLANQGQRSMANTAVLAGMMSIFALVAAFVGGMNIAMDTIAGERERHSLLPLLLNPVRRLEILLGKWLALSLFAIAGLMLNLAGFAVVFSSAQMRVAVSLPRLALVLVLGILPLPLLAASVQLLLSTVCRAIKEAQTYLSLIVFLPMAIGMFLVFFPAAQGAWTSVMPLAGQQLEMDRLLAGHEIDVRQPFLLGCMTLALSVLILRFAANRLHRDEIVYGN